MEEFLEHQKFVRWIVGVSPSKLSMGLVEFGGPKKSFDTKTSSLQAIDFFFVNTEILFCFMP